MAEYDERDVEEDDIHHNHHSRTGSKFQWQNVLSGGITESNTSANTTGEEPPSNNNNNSNNTTRQLSRCYSARTAVVRRNLNPVFNEEFRFEVADDTLLQVSILCHDMLSEIHDVLLCFDTSYDSLYVLFEYRHLG